MAGLWHRLLLAQDFALINPLQVDSALWLDLHVLPLIPAGCTAHSGLMPQLLELRAMAEEARLQLLDRIALHQRHSRFPFFSALAVAGLPTELAMTRLSRRLVVRGPGGRALLRYYDPGVFRHLRWLLEPDQMSLLLLGIDSWSWRDAAGKWQVYRPTGQVPHSDLRLAVGQWDGLQRLGLLNQCLQQIGRHESGGDEDDAVAQSADALLQHSYERHGLTDRADRCLYVKQGVLFHPQIHRHPALADRLGRARAGGISYVSVCSDLDDSTLQRFAEDLRQSQGTLP